MAAQPDQIVSSSLHEVEIVIYELQKMPQQLLVVQQDLRLETSR